ncbi:FAD binding domain-containing protein [Arthrobacter sp. MYb227]|uniref:FAD binding domain-containing protein n=1 Tax=Arthrobacter sp. MYb227 TaxID=1848601 RepID=UPI0021570624|nr:FAD binding domain-containing protein [Arthrobacter sp. MYb227]
MNTISAMVPTTDPNDFRDGDAWLAGGTVLFSYGSHSLSRLLDITAAGWEPVTITEAGIEFAATCTIAQLYALAQDPALPTAWSAADLFRPACDSFVASFKIWNLSTMGGNIATSLPAGPIISLCSALDARLLILSPGGKQRHEPVAEFIQGEAKNSLAPGELIRSILVPAHALAAKTAFRRLSLNNLGRTGVMLIGRVDPDGLFTLTVSGSTPRPHQFRFPVGDYPSPAKLVNCLEERLSPDDYHDDIHGRQPWRRAMTLRLGVEILNELFSASGPGIER